MDSKRVFDVLCAIGLLLLLSWVLLIGWIVAALDTGTNGIFIQVRIGQYAKPFKIFKLRTIHPENQKISAAGRILRDYKIDELPQLINVLFGTMSMVGPRPDVPGYYDVLDEEDRDILVLKPGITGPATLKYAKEEQFLQKQDDPQKYNIAVIFPDKVKINKAYLKHRTLGLDIKIMVYTLLGKRMKEDYFN